jgi:hypothetical protein
LQEAEFKRNQLTRIDATSIHTKIIEGSLISTNENTLFLAAPLGKIQFNSEEVFVISTLSPLGKLLMGKKAGESISFNQRQIHITSIA